MSKNINEATPESDDGEELPGTLHKAHALIKQMRSAGPNLAKEQANALATEAMKGIKQKADERVAAITTELNTAKDRIAELESAYSASGHAAALLKVTTERDEARAEVVKKNENLNLLEGLCGVMGVAPEKAVKVWDLPQNSPAQLAAQWMQLRADGRAEEAAKFYAEHEAVLFDWARQNS